MKEPHLSVELTTNIVAAYVANNPVPVRELPTLINSVFNALCGIGNDVSARGQSAAVSIRASIKPDYLICLEDGKRLKMLKRYLRSHYNMTPDEYRAKSNLPPDYPMTAPNYAERRSAIAKDSGLGKFPSLKGRGGSKRR